MQNAINAQSAMLEVLGHLAHTRDDTVREVLAFVAVMLFGGNETVQVMIVGTGSVKQRGLNMDVGATRTLLLVSLRSRANGKKENTLQLHKNSCNFRG